jgi:PAS domain S-box-containing protein
MLHRTGPSVPPSTNELEQVSYALDQSTIVAITDIPGRIKYVNAKFCEISKYSREELIGQDHRILNSGYHSEEFIRGLWQTIARGHIWRGEIRNRAKDGSLYWVDTTIVPFLDERGKPWQYMAIRHDMTERKQHEQRLLDQAALTTLGEMAAVVAHEVRNPLAGIRGGVQLLASLFQDSDGAEGRGLVGEIVARIDSLNVVVNDLLAFARVREIKAAPIDVQAFFTDLAASFRLDPVMSRIDLRVESEPGMVVDADVDQLRLVFANLLLNAAQAMSGEGPIELTASPSGRDRLALTVADAGPGIPVDLRGRVLEPFFTTKHRGTGLGLPTAKRIVEAHGGELVLTDAPGGGTAVRVILRAGRLAELR